MRLLRVELTRLFRRRACLILLLLGLLGVGLVAGTYLSSHQPPSATELAFATRMAERQADDRWVQREVDRCEAGEGRYRSGFDCEQIRPSPEDFIYTPRMTLTGSDSAELIIPIVLALAIAALLVGATYIGADWSSGTVSTLLLFESRRT